MTFWEPTTDRLRNEPSFFFFHDVPQNWENLSHCGCYSIFLPAPQPPPLSLRLQLKKKNLNLTEKRKKNGSKRTSHHWHHRHRLREKRNLLSRIYIYFPTSKNQYSSNWKSFSSSISSWTRYQLREFCPLIRSSQSWPNNSHHRNENYIDPSRNSVFGRTVHFVTCPSPPG